ncbi:MAG: DMT family transporter [Flavobacteriaceae bacterium]
MDNSKLKWVYLISLSLVWGSSFILMKYALIGLTPIQVGAFRIIITALFLMIIAFKSINNLTRQDWKYIAISSIIGTFIPVFLFSFAIKHLDSSVAAILNSFTPFNALIVGALFFGFSFRKNQIIGLLVGLTGTILLILNGSSIEIKQSIFYSSGILLASLGYAFNVNIIKKHLNSVNPLAITTATFLIAFIPTVFVLASTSFFTTFSWTPIALKSFLYVIILAIIGTAIAKTFFNKLVQISSPIFSTSVTYLIPIVAVFWGILDGENLTLSQLFSGFVILLGVYLMNRK